MLVTGFSHEEFKRITAQVSGRFYGGNVVTRREYTVLSDTRFRATLTVTDSSGRGARRSARGQRGPYACWHAYRDVLIGVFATYPKARVRTGMALYAGEAGFRANYPDTGSVNIGSQVLPVTMPECCECGGNQPMTAAEYRAQFEVAFAAHFSANRITPRTAGDDDYYEDSDERLPADGGPSLDERVFGPSY